MARLRFDFINGLLHSAIDSDDTTINSDGLEDLPTIVSPDYVAIVLDPSKKYGKPEVAYITSHTYGSPLATVERGKENTTSRHHKKTTAWVHGLITSDFNDFVGPPGPPGEQGETGAQGPSGINGYYIHSQIYPPASVWTINHNLGFYPAITVVDVLGTEIEPDIYHDNVNTARCVFNGATAGVATCS